MTISSPLPPHCLLLIPANHTLCTDRLDSKQITMPRSKTFRKKGTKAKPNSVRAAQLTDVPLAYDEVATDLPPMSQGAAQSYEPADYEDPGNFLPGEDAGYPGPMAEGAAGYPDLVATEESVAPLSISIEDVGPHQPASVGVSNVTKLRRTEGIEVDGDPATMEFIQPDTR